MKYRAKILWGIFALCILFLACYILIMGWIQGLRAEAKQNEHGCVVSLGYTWNSTDQMCVKEWEKVLCADESRNVGACVEIYNPVCGFPAKQTFSNECMSCLNKDILYYVKGVCQ